MATFRNMLLKDFGIEFYGSEIRAKWLYHRLNRQLHRQEVEFQLLGGAENG